MRKCIFNATVVGPEKILPHHAVIINEDRILSILPMDELRSCIPQASLGNEGEKVIYFNAQDGYIMPGFIDIHSDYIEGILQPRPNCLMEFEMGLREVEKQLLGHGVTTIFHSLSFLKDGGKGPKNAVRTKKSIQKLVGLIKDFPDGYHLIRHRFHARYEIDNLDIYDYLAELINSGKIHLLSFMDHTPGQGQYRDIEVLAKTYPHWNAEISKKTIEGVLAEAQAKPVASHEMLKRLASLAHEKNIPLASHDDDTLEKLSLMKNEYNITISEFPIEQQVAKKAHDSGILVVVGAPNVLLGGSHSGNLSAIEAIKAGVADILCSDYYPSSLLHSVFKLEESGILSLPDAVKMLTLNPAKAVGIDADYGTVEVGKKADLLLIRKIQGKPMVCKCFIDGSTVLQIEYRLGDEKRAAS